MARTIEDFSRILHLEAIENLDPAHWHDILLDGPKRDGQLENVKTGAREQKEEISLNKASIDDHLLFDATRSLRFLGLDVSDD